MERGQRKGSLCKDTVRVSQLGKGSSGLCNPVNHRGAYISGHRSCNLYLAAESSPVAGTVCCGLHPSRTTGTSLQQGTAPPRATLRAVTRLCLVSYCFCETYRSCKEPLPLYEERNLNFCKLSSLFLFTYKTWNLEQHLFVLYIVHNIHL